MEKEDEIIKKTIRKLVSKFDDSKGVNALIYLRRSEKEGEDKGELGSHLYGTRKTISETLLIQCRDDDDFKMALLTAAASIKFEEWYRENAQ
jgi:hypothetical protein